GLVRGRTMLKGWRWIIFISFVFTAVMVPTPEPITLIVMASAIAGLFFGAIAIAMIHDRRKGTAADEELDDDQARSIDGPSRLDDAEEARLCADSRRACSPAGRRHRGPHPATAGRLAFCCGWPACRWWPSRGRPRRWPGLAPRRCACRSPPWSWWAVTGPS